MTDGIFPAVASELTSAKRRGRGIATVGFGTAGGRLLAGLAFGVIWGTLGVEPALALFLGALVLAWVVAGVVLTPVLRHPNRSSETAGVPNKTVERRSEQQ